MGNFAVIDIETSGFSQNLHGICQIAGKIVTQSFELVATFDHYIKPYGCIYTKKALEINGLSEEFLNEHGEPLGVVMNEFSEFIFENNVTTLIGHNFKFDKRFLFEELRRTDVIKAIQFDRLKVEDTYKMPWPKFLKDKTLKTICAYYNIKYVGKHNAMEDVESTLELFQMVKEFRAYE